MKILNKLFGKKQDDSSLPVNQELNLAYNIMSDITLEQCKKYENSQKYEFVENNIYKDLMDDDDAKYRMAISYDLESADNSNQLPLEDILDKYLLHVSDFMESDNDDNSNKFIIELGGTLDDVKKAQEIIGKKVFNRDFLDNGQIRVNLIIE